MTGFDILMFSQKNDDGKIGWPFLESSMHLRNSRKHFHRCASFGAVDYDIWKKEIFVRFRRFFIVGTKVAVFGIQTTVLRINRRFRGGIFVMAMFGDFSLLGQKLPFWDESCRFRDDFFVRAIFGNFFKFLR